jgi:hypothetical protein
MAAIKITGGWYDDESHHGYYSESGRWIPSATQLLGLAGFSDYSMVPPEVLERKKVIGKEAHSHCANIDMYGDVDPSWVSDDAKPYVEAYQLFRHQHNFTPDPQWVETPVIVDIFGMQFGVTPDAIGKLGKFDAILERKCVNAPQASWSIQTALQEFARFKASHIGRAQRFAVQLLDTGKFKLDPHMNHSQDESRAIAALTVIYARLDDGQKLWEQV